MRTDYPGSESSRELSLRGAKVPGNFHSREWKFPGTFVPGSESSRELSLPGAKVLSRNFRSEDRKNWGAKSPDTFFCTCSYSSSFMHCFRIARCAFAVHCDYRVAQYPLEDTATYWTRTFAYFTGVRFLTGHIRLPEMVVDADTVQTFKAKHDRFSKDIGN